MATRISNEDKQMILRLREEGLGYAKIGKEIGRSEEGVRLVCNPKAREKSRVYTKGYHVTHREQERTRAHEWRVTHPEEAQKHDHESHLKRRVKRNAESREYKVNHPEEMAAYSRRYTIEHREERRQYCIDNHERILSRSRRYHDEHREQRREYGRKFSHTEAGRLKSRNHSHRRREIMGHGRGFTLQDFRQLWTEQEGKCAYCGRSMIRYEDVQGTLLQKIACNEGDYCHTDHVVPLSKGGLHDPSNIVLACARCNVKKSDSVPQQLMEVLV